jgi:hypothetical protein
MALTQRHAASPSVDARTSRPWDGRSSRKLPWFTFLALVEPVDLKSGRERQPKQRRADAVFCVLFAKNATVLAVWLRFLLACFFRHAFF